MEWYPIPAVGSAEDDCVPNTKRERLVCSSASDRDCYLTMRVNVNDGFALLDLPIGRPPNDPKLLHVEGHEHIVAFLDFDSGQILRRDVELNISESVYPQHASAYRAVPCRFCEGDQQRAYRAGINNGPEILDLCLPGCKHGGRRTEDVPAGEGRSLCRKLKTVILKRHNEVGPTNHRDGRGKQPVVRTNEVADRCARSYCLPACSNTWINNGKEHTFRHVLNRSCERHRPTVNIAMFDPVGDVDDPRRRGDASDDTMDNTDEFVRVTKVAEEGDGCVHYAQE